MAVPGTMGKILIIDLSTREISVETPSDEVYLQHLGGYGLGAHYLYKLQKPGVDARPLPAWGLCARNVDTLQLVDIRLSCVKDDLRHAIVCDGVKHLTLDDVRFPRVAGAADPLVLEDVGHLDAPGQRPSAAEPR